MSCYSSRHDSTSNYRVDRMDGVKIIDESCSPKALALRDEVAAYTGQAFKMFGGRQEDVVLEFDRKLIGVVYDKFGESVQMLPAGENRCVATVKVRISPTFWGWLFQFAGEMRVISPAWVTEEYLAQGQKILK